LSPTVRTKYPSSHISPLHILFLSEGYSLNNSRALMLFRVFTASLMEVLGGNVKKICTWSSATSISSISYSYSSAISLKSSAARSRTGPCANRFLLYFGHHTRWYFVSYTAWLALRNPMSYHNTQSLGGKGVLPVPLTIPLGKDAIHPRPKGRGILACFP